MEGKQWVDQVSRLLGKAKAQSIAAHGNLDALKVSIDAAFSEIERIKTELIDRKSTRLNSSHSTLSRMPSSA